MATIDRPQRGEACTTIRCKHGNNAWLRDSRFCGESACTALFHIIRFTLGASVYRFLQVDKVGIAAEIGFCFGFDKDARRWHTSYFVQVKLPHRSARPICENMLEACVSMQPSGKVKFRYGIEECTTGEEGVIICSVEKTPSNFIASSSSYLWSRLSTLPSAAECS